MQILSYKRTTEFEDLVLLRKLEPCCCLQKIFFCINFNENIIYEHISAVFLVCQGHSVKDIIIPHFTLIVNK